MKKRTIGGVGFVVLFYFTLLSKSLFLVLLSIFLIAGIIELKNIFNLSNEKVKTALYGIAFVLFILSMGYLSIIKTPLVIYLTILLMLDDTLAYIVGKSIGKHKLSKISPNKTIEGSLGGLLLSPFISVALMSFLTTVVGDYTPRLVTFDFATIGDYNPFAFISTLIVVSFLLALLGQVGDLTESYFKRSAGIKDSGTIVYGHGGILDRVDSWIFPTILMTVIMLFI